MRLYHYYHCPFCVRLRMTLGFLDINYENCPLPYHDEETPKKLSGKKMLPILVNDQGKAQNESLDIMASLDSNNLLNMKDFLNSPDLEEIQSWCDRLGKNVHKLAMPYWIYTKEFDEKSRKYFQEKKEVSKGPFSQLVKNKEEYITLLNKDLEQLEGLLCPFYKSDAFRVHDILLASHLWGMYIVPEYQFSPKIHCYLQSVKEKCNFQYMDALWT